jgi:CspA family cold shock protein
LLPKESGTPLGGQLEAIHSNGLIFGNEWRGPSILPDEFFHRKMIAPFEEVAASGRSGITMSSIERSTSDFGSDLSGSNEPTHATVKWFNATKGFGFVTLRDGTDAFCHASALAKLGSPNLPPGATVHCDVAPGPRDMQVTSIHAIDLSTADAQSARGARPARPQFDGPSGPMGNGHVKFFNEQKGFGFVVPADGSTDVYLHASALRRSGLPTLSPEQKIRFSIRRGTKGAEVDRIELI